METASDKKPLCVVCADVGSVKKGRFGWAGRQLDASESRPVERRNGRDPAGMADYVAGKLAEGHPVALGFECPLWIPLTADQNNLTNGRAEDGNRAWSANGGALVLAASLPITAWTLRRIRVALIERGLSHERIPVAADLTTFQENPQGLLLWEAFISGTNKAADYEDLPERQKHIADAHLGARAFIRRWRAPVAQSKIPDAPDETLSLIGMALLRSGWTHDISILHRPVEIVRPVQSKR